MENNNSNRGLVIAMVIICILVGVVCFMFGKNKAITLPSTTETPNNTEITEDNSKVEETTKEEVSNEPSSQVTNKVECPEVEEKNSLYVFDHNAAEKGYNVYSYLENQGAITLLVDYKKNLYRISEQNQTSCIYKLYEGVKFKNNENDCTENEEKGFGSIYNFNVSIPDLANAYAIQSYSSDGREFDLIVFKSGKVNRYNFAEHLEVKKDYFNGYKVKELKNYECSKYNKEAGFCTKVKYTVVLQDGTTKTIEKSDI